MKRVINLLLCFIMVLSCACGCSVLEGEVVSITEHVSAEVQNDKAEVTAEVNSYDALRDAVYGIVEAHENSGTIRIIDYSFENFSSTLEDAVNRACVEIANEEPLGLYCVYYIGNTITQLVSFTEVEIAVTYKRDRAQTSTLTSVSTTRYLYSELTDMLKNYKDYGAFYTSLDTLNTDDITEFITQTYYDNPLDICMMNLDSLTFYPETGRERILEVVFDSQYSASQRKSMSSALNNSVNKLVESADGESDAELLLSLCELLTETCAYDAVSAEGASYLSDDLVATAYGALVSGRAVSDGYALAFKALCDKLGLECTVVSGSLNGIAHKWNIVTIDDDSYNIDAAMCDENGISTAFLKNDDDFSQTHSWDTEKYGPCSGSLSYERVAGIA